MAQEARRYRPGRAIGLNENLARELLELHTLGGGHSQADVQELARALTGWTVGGPRPFDEVAPLRGRFAFQPEAHDPGGPTFPGNRHPQGGGEQALALPQDLSRPPPPAPPHATT